MEIRDAIHGSIVVTPDELLVIHSPYFQRLRQIKQMGFGEYAFPGAHHNRFIHSLGAMQVVSSAFDSIFKLGFSAQLPFKLSSQGYSRFRSLVRMAALLHDVGHGPLSHAIESAMPEVSVLKLPAFIPSPSSRKATHEDYTLKMILDSGLTPLIEQAGKPFGYDAIHLAALFHPDLFLEDPMIEFFKEGGIDFRPILSQLISSELDADRMDYLRRDSLHSGVSYGGFDFNWILSNLTANIENNRCYLALQHRALYAFEDFLIARFHMFLMVYFHHKSVVYDEMLSRYFSSSDCQYRLPTDMEEYCGCTDAQLYYHLSKSQNEWARRIVEKRPYRRLIEIHSGIPALLPQSQTQQRLLEDVKKRLIHQNVHYLVCTSTGELSKYFRKPGDAIFVRYHDSYHPPVFIPLEQCTDLYQRYESKRSITRIYTPPEISISTPAST